MGLATGQIILEKYEIVELLGTGSLGDVYLARDVLLDREVVVKHLQIPLELGQDALRRLSSELRIVATMSHPNIATIYSLDRDEENYYLTMEYAEGGSLRDLLAVRCPLPVPMALEIATGICRALDAAHSQGVIHRDVKPSNILIPSRGTLVDVKLADFGLVMGPTPSPEDASSGAALSYAAPEQITGAPIDRSSDIYSLGIVLYEMLVGHTPFPKTKDITELMAAILEQTPLPPSQARQDVPKKLDEILLTALNKSPQKRYQQAKDMCNALMSVLKTYKQTQLVEEHYQRGQQQLKQGQWKEALNSFELVLKLQPDFPGAAERLYQARRKMELDRLYEQGTEYYSQRDWRRAIEAFQKILDMDAAHMDTRERLEEVRKRSSLQALYQEALECERAEQWSKARNIYLEILSSTPDYQDVVARLKKVSTAEQAQVLLEQAVNHFGRRAPQKVAVELMKLFEMISPEFEAVSIHSKGDIHLFALYKPSPSMSATLFPLIVPVLLAGRDEIQDEDVEVLRHILAERFGPSARIGFLLVFADELLVEDARRLLASKMQRPFAFDIVVLSHQGLFQIAAADDPKQALRRRILSYIDLSTVSPFVITGPTPDNVFFGRESEIREITEHVSTKSYAIIGGRRIGKSSLLGRLHRVRLPAAGFRTLYHDCSTTPIYDAFVAATVRDWRPESPPSSPITLGQLIQSVIVRSPVNQVHRSQSLVVRASLLSHYLKRLSGFRRFRTIIQPPSGDKPLVLLLDEADKLVPSDRANGWRLFNELRALVNSGHAQVILSGERALREALQDPASPLFNFANEMLLGPLDFHSVEELITRPMDQLEIELVDEKPIVDRIWTFTSGHPNIVQRLCRRLIERLNEQGVRSITLDDVNSVVEDPRFQRDDFLTTYWQNATLLERVLSLLLAQANQQPYTLRDARRLLDECLGLVGRDGAKPSGIDVDAALGRLVDLRSILEHKPQGYIFAVSAFPRVVTQPDIVTIDDLFEMYSEAYSKYGDLTLEEIADKEQGR
jgi:tetratricopeptide (TPR) repeat protein